MAATQVRIRSLATPCPRCGGSLRVEEHGEEVAEFPDPIGWAPVRRFCAHGCLLTVADFPAGQDVD